MTALTMLPSREVNGELHEALKDLIIDNSDLNALESMLSEFNIFEAVGNVRQELRHSDFLAFLLDPARNNGLSDRVLKKLLMSAFANVQSLPQSPSLTLSPLEIDLADLSDVEVRREWRNIDLLIYSPSNRWVIAIENKVDSTESRGQLKRYEEVINREFHDCEKKAFLYLTKEGGKASREDWKPISYGAIADILEAIQSKSPIVSNGDVHTLVKHYISLIRRHLMSDSEIAQICRKIYKQHHKALDLIYAHRFDRQLQISNFLQELVRETPSPETRPIIELDDSNKWWVRFAPTCWDEHSFQKECKGWTSTHRLVLFEFVINGSKFLDLNLVIGPGNSDYKKSIFKAVRHSNSPGIRNSQLIPDKWSPIISQRILHSSDYIEKDWEELQADIESFWNKFIANDLTVIHQAILNLEMPVAVTK